MWIKVNQKVDQKLDTPVITLVICRYNQLYRIFDPVWKSGSKACGGQAIAKVDQKVETPVVTLLIPVRQYHQ